MAVEYPTDVPWLQGNPADRLKARQSFPEVMQSLASTKAVSDEDAQRQQEFKSKTAAAAQKLIADQKLKQTLSALDRAAPDYNQKAQSAILQWSADSGQFNPGTAQTIRALNPTPQKPQPGFSLKPGETRYGPDGKPLASLPALPPKPQNGFSLRPGETRYGPDGKPIANLPGLPPKPTQPLRDPQMSELAAERLAAYKAHIAKPTDADLTRAYNVANDALMKYVRENVKGGTLPAASAAPAPAAPKAEAKYKTPADVKQAVKSKQLSKEDAAKVLQDQFGFSP